jgi:hypothetical protein
VLLVLCVVLASGCGTGAGGGLGPLPREVDGWVATAPDRIYRGRELYDYLDGAAEVYLAYDFRAVLVRRFHKPEAQPIVLDIFAMGCPEDAFGVFSFERQGPEAGFGQGSEYSAGLLRFWQGRFFVSVYTEKETLASRAAIWKLGRLVAQALPRAGGPPQLLSLLSPTGLLAEQVRYFHRHGALNYHYFLATDNLLQLSAQTEAVLGRYRFGEQEGRLLLIRYPDRRAAARAWEAFRQRYLPEAGSAAPVQLENGRWCAAVRQGEYVVIVLEATEAALAQDLLEATRKRLVQARARLQRPDSAGPRSSGGRP